MAERMMEVTSVAYGDFGKFIEMAAQETFRLNAIDGLFSTDQIRTSGSIRLLGTCVRDVFRSGVV